MESIRIIFRGRVQGVFFRANAKQCAEELGVKGFVRNLADGDVELLAQGPSEKISQLEHKLLKTFLCHVAKKEDISFDPLPQFDIIS